MKRLLCLIFCAWLTSLPARGEPSEQGSQLPTEANYCLRCHGSRVAMERQRESLYVSKDQLSGDIHAMNGVNCHDCHGGDPSAFSIADAHVRDISPLPQPQAAGAAKDLHRGKRQPMRLPFLVSSEDVWQSCARCHPDQAAGLARSVHGGDSLSEAARPSACRSCHGAEVHAMTSVTDPASPVYLDRQLQLCGTCHKGELVEYHQSLHGRAMEEGGLVVVAVCADCHGAHGIYPAADPRSTLHPERVASTCGHCHYAVEQRLEQSVHGGLSQRLLSPGQRLPSCTDCHPDHEREAPEGAAFRHDLAQRCGGCHDREVGQYALSMHGELTELGYKEAATCADCHGAHDILPLSDPRSRMAGDNRLRTCRECHPGASRNFAGFDPHADHRSFAADLDLHLVFLVLMTFLISTFSFFALHSLLWLVRGLADWARVTVFAGQRQTGRGISLWPANAIMSVLLVWLIRRPRLRKQRVRSGTLVPGAKAVVRFGSGERAAHLVMAISFLGLALTGLPLKYSQHEWAHVVAGLLGGFSVTGMLHRLFGVMNMSILAIFVVRMVRILFSRPRSPQAWFQQITSPDSPVPTLRDVHDCRRMIGWFLGQNERPTFERWTYWEKYDFWGAAGDIVVIGLTGLILWFPEWFCQLLPGRLVNVAKVIHSTQALLATGFVFAIHFFNTHLRPDKFPMDMSVLTGFVSLEEMEHERPAFLARMRREGKLDRMIGTVPQRGWLIATQLGGWAALAVGLLLLAGIVLPLLGQ